MLPVNGTPKYPWSWWPLVYGWCHFHFVPTEFNDISLDGDVMTHSCIIKHVTVWCNWAQVTMILSLAGIYCLISVRDFILIHTSLDQPLGLSKVMYLHIIIFSSSFQFNYRFDFYHQFDTTPMWHYFPWNILTPNTQWPCVIISVVPVSAHIIGIDMSCVMLNGGVTVKMCVYPPSSAILAQQLEQG